MTRATGRRTAAQETGLGEDEPARFLAEQGLAIVARNYRTRFGEIDLVARDGATLVFVEVRCASPAASATRRRASPRASSAASLGRAPLSLAPFAREPPCRFDVVTLDGGRPRGCARPSTRPG
jgi:putative endonuclease